VYQLRDIIRGSRQQYPDAPDGATVSGKESAPNPSSPHNTAKPAAETPYATPDHIPSILPGRGGGQLAQRARLLQPVIGNRATQRLLAPQRPPRVREVAPSLVQRQVLTKLTWSETAKTPTITDAIIGGRTPPPFSGTMGAHSTAWVAHIDLVRRMVVNLPLETACTNLRTVAKDEMTNSPLRKLKVDKNQEELIDKATKALTSDLADLKDKTNLYRYAIDPNTDKTTLTKSQNEITIDLIVQLRKTIDSYLTLVNYLPGATVADGDPGGHGEGAARNDINTFEYIYALWRRQGEYLKNPKLDGKAEKGELDTAIKGLGDKGIPKLIADAAEVEFDPDQTEKLQTELMASLWTMFAAETPAVQSGKKLSNEIDDTWTALLQNFLNVTRMAYPETFAFTKMHDSTQQQLGLDVALTQASKNKRYTEMLSGIKSSTALGGVKVKPSTTRGIDQAPAVTSSDLGSASSGFQANVLVDGNGEVGDIVTTGRTPSPFSGTMGAHSTAWVAHIDAIRRTLGGLSVDKAIEALVNKMEEALKDPSLLLLDTIDFKHKELLNQAGDELTIYISVSADVLKKQPHEQVFYLEDGIAKYLTYINFLPLSTIYEGKTDGRAEGMHRGFLINHEENPPKTVSVKLKKLLAEHLLGLYDWENVEKAGSSLKDKETVKATDKYVVADKRFLDTIKEAYPQSYKDSEMSQELLDSLRKESGKKEEFIPTGKAATEVLPPSHMTLRKRKSNVLDSNNNNNDIDTE
jgi:hypothetical protein